MLDNSDDAEAKRREQAVLRQRIAEALQADGAPTPGQIAAACGVTEQAVNNWKRTGKITTTNLLVLARESRKPVEWFYDLAPLPTTNPPSAPSEGDPPISLHADEKDLLTAYRRLLSKGKVELLNAARQAADEADSIRAEVLSGKQQAA